MVKNDNLAPQKARLNFHQGILNSMLFNLFRPMTQCFSKDCVLVLKQQGICHQRFRGEY